LRDVINERLTSLILRPGCVYFTARLVSRN